MLDQETKRKIDSARDILVGKVPDPKAQVEQITNALIYKFMDDMDRQAEELGGKPSFFTNGFEKYSWGKLMDPKLGSQGRIDLYVEAITSMSQNPHLPQLFRDIFKDAFLPFRSPETLSMFLKEINCFNYDHSEDLGDAFEYLLSVMAAQGDAGQFRTPRHIIDFIVDVVNPQKDETILDPACGTAGFLISAYKHIIADHDGKDNITGKPTNKDLPAEASARAGKPLTPDEKKKMMNNFVGYDISPDMVKLSRVNMYLHGFPEPKISEYDTLSSEDKWDEMYDVIMANPPFMTPKGGIRPHKRFSVQANRSEVLFVDYILEHLNQKGRAGIIVPEGIIFQSANAYKKLRQLLIEDGLFAVVSLPAGVFNPYSGVKTSILFFDNQIAKLAKNILFVKITDDGFNLGAQRRKLDTDGELPIALQILKTYREGFDKGIGGKFKIDKSLDYLAWLTHKEKITEDGDYNLSGDRYREVEVYKNQKWEMVELGEVCEFKNGLWKGKKEPFKKVKIIRNTNFSKTGDLNLSDVAEHLVEKRHLETRGLQYGDIILENSGGGPTQPVGRVVFFNVDDNNIYSFSNFTSRIRVDDDRIDSKYLFLILNNFYQQGKTEKFQKQTSGIRNLDKKLYQKIKIPLPPIEVQKEIVEQIEIKQNAINHAKEIIKNLERERRYFGRELRKLEDVEMVELGKVCEIYNGSTPLRSDKSYWENGKIPWFTVDDIRDQGRIIKQTNQKITEKALKKTSVKLLPPKTILLCCTASVGECAITEIETTTNQQFNGLVIKDKYKEKLDSYFLFQLLRNFKHELIRLSGKTSFNFVPVGTLKQIKIPLPSLKIQKQLVAEAEKEEEIITANRRLIEIMERKIEKVIEEV